VNRGSDANGTVYLGWIMIVDPTAVKSEGFCTASNGLILVYRNLLKKKILRPKPEDFQF
jgi:hypothetical protein